MDQQKNDAKLNKLLQLLKEMESLLVAYSGGVDSSLLLAAASQALGDKVLAVTAVSELMSKDEIREAQDLARSLGVRHQLLYVDDLGNKDFAANPPDRCYHCKKFRFLQLKELAEKENLHWVAEGSNLDDLTDYRPGHLAVAELGIRSPLKEVGLTKQEIRTLARQLNLPVWNKPAKPCLATRIPYGTPITKESLTRIGQAESFLSEILQTDQIRVREHGDLARLEISRDLFPRLLEEKTSKSVYSELKKIGYSYIAMDILGYRLGSMNETLSNRKGV